MIFILKLYKGLGMVKHSLLMSVFGYSSHCKHSPTCSEYLHQQLKQHGTITGLYRGTLRLLQCW